MSSSPALLGSTSVKHQAKTDVDISEKGRSLLPKGGSQVVQSFAEATAPPMNPQLTACLRTAAPLFTRKLSRPIGAARFAGRGDSGKPWLSKTHRHQPVPWLCQLG